MSGVVTVTPHSLTLPRLAELANAAHRSCETAYGDALAYACEAGRMLVEAKARVGHGGWGGWLAENFDASERTAQVYMQISEADLSKAQTPAETSIAGVLRQISKPKPKPRASAGEAGELLRDLRGQPADDAPAPSHRVDLSGPIIRPRNDPLADPPAPMPGTTLEPLTPQQDRKLAKIIELARDLDGKTGEIARPLSDYARAELAREAAIAAHRLEGLLNDLAFTFER